MGWAIVSALLGAGLVLVLLGPGPLNPWNQGWLLAGPLGPDPVQLWLGWHYFMAAPWGWPPGANPDYGMELGTAIYFADAIPLLALLGKALRSVVALPQYVGPWLLACGALQGLAGWWLLGSVTRAGLARALGAGLLVLQPMLINRMFGHTPLAGQFLLLLGLGLALRPGAGRGWAWAALLGVTTLVHAYLLAMLAPLWLADVVRRAVFEKGFAPPEPSPPKAARALETSNSIQRVRGATGSWWGSLRGQGLLILAPPAAVLGALWLGGFFLLRGGLDSGPGSERGGYGDWNLDLLALFDGGMWSALLPDLPDPGHWEAGSSYLGLGGLGLLAAGALAWALRPMALPRRLWPLAAVLLGMLGFAITQRVTLGGAVLAELPLPAWLLPKLDALRNAERFVWPLSYALMAGAAGLVVRAWGNRRAGWLLLGLLALQAVDLRPGLAYRAGLVAGKPAGVPQRLFDPFWAKAAPRYARLRAVPAGNMGEGWESLARYAVEAGMPTDSIYMARVDGAAVAALRAKVATLLAEGRHEPGTLYVLRDAESLALARQGSVAGRDLLVQADGYWVLAPGWFMR